MQGATRFIHVQSLFIVKNTVSHGTKNVERFSNFFSLSREVIQSSFIVMDTISNSINNVDRFSKSLSYPLMWFSFFFFFFSSQCRLSENPTIFSDKVKSPSSHALVKSGFCLRKIFQKECISFKSQLSVHEL